MTPRTAKRIAQLKLEEMAVEDDNVLSGDLEEDISADEGSGAESEYESTEKRMSTAPPPKRMKTSGITEEKSPVKQSRTGKKSLSLLPTMPLDVLFEIFGNLSPKDIFSLAKTNKLFRQTLLSPNAITVWMTARRRFEAPDPPDDMSEIAWAALLFGNTCQNCGAKNIQKVDFLLRLRVCNACKKKHLVAESRFERLSLNVDPYILDLIPYTHTAAHGYAGSRRFFWEKDIRNIVAKLAAYEDDVHRRRPNATQKLVEFKGQQMERIMEIKSTASQYSAWLKSFASERQRNSEELQKQRRDSIFQRFIQLGYAEGDVSPQSHRREFQSTTQLSDRVWRRIRPILEPDVLANKARRLEAEFSIAQEARRHIVDGLYQTYKASLHPSQWKYLPRTFDICKLGPFAQFIDAPVDSTVTAANFTEAIQALPGLISSVSEERKARARALLPQKSATSHNPETRPDPGELDDLELAISVFECPASNNHGRPFILIGPEDLVSHHCDDFRLGLRPMFTWNRLMLTNVTMSDVSFSQKGSKIAADLVCLADLDPKSALASDMDRKDLRFTCGICLPQNSSGSWFRFGYSWRTAITHVLKHPHPGFDLEYSWTILSTEDANAVKACEQSDCKWDQKKWTCGHCSTYMMNLQRREDMLEHLESGHQITNPSEPKDLVFFERYQSPLQGKITYPVPRPTHEQLNNMLEQLNDKLKQTFGPDSVLYVPPAGTGMDMLFEFPNMILCGMNEFGMTDLFGPDGDVNFERDFGQWFNPDDVVGSLDLK